MKLINVLKKYYLLQSAASLNLFIACYQFFLTFNSYKPSYNNISGNSSNSLSFLP